MRKGAIGSAAVATAAFATLAGPARTEPSPDAGYRAMVDRPLFSPTRRPPPPAPASDPMDIASPVPVASPAPDVSLSGVISGGGMGVALLKRPLDAAPVRVGLGGQVDGWTVSEIHPRSIVLRRDARSVTVDLQSSMR